MVRYKRILEEYFGKLKNFFQNNSAVTLATAELSFRPFLDIFFTQLTSIINPSISRIFEPRNQGKYGRPDWVFTDTQTMGIYGYVEAKGLSPEGYINIDDYKAQVSKYLTLGNPVLLTDGIEFVYFDVNGSIDKFVIFEKPIKWDAPKFNLSSLSYFQKFFSKIGFRTIPENLVITELSRRANALSRDLLELLQLEEDEAETETELQTVHTLKRLWDIASTNLDTSLSDDKTFAGFVSQILAFGLLYAHRFIHEAGSTPSENYDKLHYFWTQKRYESFANNVEPFVHLFKALSDELNSKLSKIGGWYDNTRRLMSFVKLNRSTSDKPNFHKLYEDFLIEYDRETRIDYGAWYTPLFLSDFLAKLVNFHICVNPSLCANAERPFHIIDPCCGTGTIIESSLEYINLPEHSEVIGFEILPVPYALANYRLSLFNITNGISLSVLLTNTLGNNTFVKPDYDLSKLDSIGLFFAKEQIASYKLSQPPLTIIIGNPPCSDSAVTNAGSCLEALMTDFRPPIRRGRQNTQMQLNNEWIKFFRWALYKALNSKPAVVAFILPSTFAANVSFKYARKYLFENSNEISVLEFDSDNRVESANQNIFNALQGRLILVATFTSDACATFIRYKDIRSYSRTEKIEYFNNDLENIQWDAVPVNEDYCLRPTGEYDVDLYSRFINLSSTSNKHGIFLRHCSGMKLAPTHLLVHFSKGQLSRRCRFIADQAHTYTEIKDRWYSGQAKPPSESKLSSDVKKILSSSYRNSSRYSYRPFLEAYVNDNPELLKALTKEGGGGMRFRPEVKAAYTDPNVFGFAVAPAPAEISREINKFCSFCWFMPDNDLSTRGNAHIFCNQFPEYKRKKDWSPNTSSNVNSVITSTLTKIFNVSQEQLVDDIVFYSYAILTSPYFLRKFAPKLHALG